MTNIKIWHRDIIWYVVMVGLDFSISGRLWVIHEVRSGTHEALQVVTRMDATGYTSFRGRRTMVLASMVEFCKFASYAGWKWQIIEGNSWQKKWKDIQILKQKRAIHFPTHFLRCCAPPPSPLASPVPRDIKGPTPSIDEETGWTRSELGVLS